MRNNDPLTEQLRRWGHAQVNRFALSRGDRSIHVLGKVRDSAPLTKEAAVRELAPRDGAARRRMMAAGTGVKGLGIVPMWAADPIRASNDADHPHDNAEIAVDMGTPDDLRWVDRALATMARSYLLRSIVIRVEFTAPSNAGPAARARMACERFEAEMARVLGIDPKPKEEGEEPALTPRQYRYELSRGLDHLRGMQLAA
ncbi:TPA: hypothetical protein UM674_000622 [Stenotrophomonas maltophilia]|nr:hypothetical protein [Stenotrophomonas maltophilia]